jgi:hypothetical protein
MKEHKTSGGKWVLATYFPARKRFRTEHTVDGIPCEARSVDDLKSAVTYSHKRSAKRALKRKQHVGFPKV